MCPRVRMPGASWFAASAFLLLAGSLGAAEIAASDDHILIDGSPLFLKGVCYSPFIAGDAPWTGSGPSKVTLQKDVKDIKDLLHANAARLYDPLPKTFYDAARQNGVWVIQGIFLPFDAGSHAQDPPGYLLTPTYLAAQKNRIKSAIDSIHSMAASDTILAYVLGNGFDSQVVANTIRSPANQGRPPYQGKYYSAPAASPLPKIDVYNQGDGPEAPCCQKPPASDFPGGRFPDPLPFQSFLAELADYAADYEMTRYGKRHLIGHAIGPAHNPFLGARDRPVPAIETPVDLSFLDVIFENLFTYSHPYLAYYGFPAYLERLKAAYPATPVVVLETGYSTSTKSAGPAPAPCGFPYREPRPFTMKFGGASDADQALALEARWVDVACSKRPLAGFFVFEYYDEWWYTGAINVQEDEPLEHFGLKRVKGTPGNFTVTDKPAFAKLAQLYGCEEPSAAAGPCALVQRSPRLIEATFGKAFNFAFQAEGGKPPYLWSIDDPGQLPLGIEGFLFGIPQRLGDFRFRVRVEDSSSPPLAQERLYCLRVGQPKFSAQGREIFLNDEPFYLKGIDYSPLIAGDAPWSCMRHADPFADMKEIREKLHANAIRVYQALPKTVYDAARANGLFVIQGIHLQIDDKPEPGEPGCATTDLDLLKPPLYDQLVEHVRTEIEEVHNLFASDVVLCWVVGNEVGFCVQRSTILKNQDRPRFKGVYYQVPDPPPRLPPLEGCDGCGRVDKFWDPHPFQSFICELVDLATGLEVEKFKTRHLMAHATDPNMSVAGAEKHRFHPEIHFPADMSFLDIVFQNVYSYFPPYLRFIGYDRYLEECAKAYPNTPFVVLECGYSTSPNRDIDHCAEGPTCCMEKEGIVQADELNLCFGGNTEEEQAKGLSRQFRKATARRGLTAGFFAFEYFEEWWKAGNRSEFVQDEDLPEEWFGLKRVRGTPQNYLVSDKPAFETAGYLFDQGWCLTETHIDFLVAPDGVLVAISEIEGEDFDSIIIKRDGAVIIEKSPVAMDQQVLLVDSNPPPGERLYSAVARKRFAECPEIFAKVTVPARTGFRRGDADASGAVDITDAIATLSFLFLGTGALPCQDAADADDHGSLDISDAIYTLNRLFLGGDLIPDPGPDACGLDPTPDELPECEYPAEACKAQP